MGLLFMMIQLALFSLNLSIGYVPMYNLVYLHRNNVYFTIRYCKYNKKTSTLLRIVLLI